MLRLICILGCDFPIQLLLKSLSSMYDDRLVDRYHHVRHNVLTDTLLDAKTNKLTCCSTCSLSIQLLLCVNIIVNKCLTTNVIKY